MNLILTMAGKYKRFIAEGYKTPKYLLPWGSKTILETIIHELNKNNIFKEIFLIGNKSDEMFMPHVKSILKKLNINKENLILIHDTPGQLHTALKALSTIKHIKNNLKDPVIFHNIDTILYNRNLENLRDVLNNNEGYIDIFKSSNHNYSYVLLENDLVKTIEEKILISDNATSGFYAFSSSNIIIKYFKESDNYISQLYARMILDDCKIRISAPSSERDTIVLGTPSSYHILAQTTELE